IEKPKFAIKEGPAWLKIDPATGLLSGAPDAAGKVDVAVTVTIDQEVRKLDDSRLGWGVEKVISTSTERVGSATGGFSIEIGRWGGAGNQVGVFFCLLGQVGDRGGPAAAEGGVIGAMNPSCVRADDPR